MKPRVGWKLIQLQSLHRSQTQRCRQLEDAVVTFQGLLLRQHPKLHPLFNGSGSEEQRSMFDTFTRHAGSGLVHPTDGQIQRLLLTQHPTHTSRPSSASAFSRPSSAHRSLPPPSSSHIISSEDDEFDSFTAQQQEHMSSSQADAVASGNRTRPQSALSHGRPGESSAPNEIKIKVQNSKSKIKVDTAKLQLYFCLGVFFA